MAVNIKFTTPCGHEATVKLCQSKSGPNAGKWVVKIRGHKVKLKSGVKTIYCRPDEEIVKQSIASYLGIDLAVITNGNSAVVKKERSKMTTASATITAAVSVAPPRVSMSPYLPPVQQQPLSYSKFPPNPFPPPFSNYSHGPLPVYGNANGGIVQSFPFGSMPSAVNSASIMPAAAAISQTARTFVASSTIPCPLSSQAEPVPASSVLSHPAVAPAEKENASKRTLMVPTAEQERIYQHAKPPTPVDTNFTVRITAGAGAGKTTTILQVAAKAAELGHSHITYVTFSKAAATDGARRIQEALQNFPNAPTVEARTLHSCAMRLLSNERKEELQPDNNRLVDDEGLQAFIKSTCRHEIENFLLHAKEEIASRTKTDVRKAASMLVAAERQVCFFVFKTFTQFCRSPYTAEQFKDPSFKYRNYFPAERFHNEGMEGEKQGFPPMVYRFKIGRYADLACLVWYAANEQGIRSYDMEMKRVQLKALRIPGSLLLVDESQDMDGCQVDWISKQCNHGTHVYIVGDAAQTIYSFRGAKSKYMVNLQGAVNFELTKSWRFGPSIASMANVVLFSKHKSKQTQRDNATWQPYRVVGGGGDGIVTTDPILWKWKDAPITVISAFNATLLRTAASMLGMNVDKSDDISDSNEENVKMEFESESSSGSSQENNTQSEANQGTVPIVSDDTVKTEGTSESAEPTCAPVKKEDSLRISMPKIHINGQGENSGLRKWQSNLKQIEHIYELYKSGDDGMVLPARTFKEFNGERITWDIFCSQVESREMSKYQSSIHVVSTFQDKTMSAMDLFRREVMDKKYSAEEADVILSTTHAAKGMEWDNVQVCDDFADLFKLSCDGPLTAKRGGAGSNTKRASWQFHVKGWGDDVNLLYVACTRAKKLLCIPPSLKTFLQDCDILHEMIRFKKLFRERDMAKNSDIVVFGRKQPLSVEEALDMYQDVVLPLRMENNLQTKERLMSALIKPLDGEADYEDDIALDCDGEFERFFGCQKKPAPPVAGAATPVGINAHVGTASSVAGSAAKKPKLSRAHYVVEEASATAALAPNGTKRPYDKKDVAAHTANCRECGTDITVGTSRVGVQVYKQDKSEWWCLYFHEKCFPKELLSKLRLDPNPNRKKPAAKKSWNGKKSYGGGYKKSWGGSGWKKSGYRKRWY